MTSDVVMPRLGWTMEAGTVVEWLKRDGDPVEAGDLIFSVESDKAVVEIEALDSGILHIPADTPIGVAVPVGTPLAAIIQPGDPVPIATAATSAAAHQIAAPSAAGADPGVAIPPSTTASNGGHGKPPISPRARRLAEELGVAWVGLTGSGSTGRIRERDVRAAAQGRSSARARRATPMVRRMADQAGVSLGDLVPTHPAGRITRADVVAATGPTGPATKDQAATPLSPIRRAIVQRMTESARTIAPVTLTTDADASELVAIRHHLRDELANTGDQVPTYTDLIVRLVALALREHPALNATLTDAAIVEHQAVHVGIAVDTHRGLLVPVIRDAHRKSIHEIARASSSLVTQTRDGTIAAEDLRGGTFTITNLGIFDIDAFTPIVNLPECAILGLGRIVARPVVTDEQAGTLAVRKMIALSLTFDHRLVDGAPAARFLQRLRRMIERPYTWLTR